MPQELEKSYSPKQVEARWYRFWEEKGFFTADNSSSRPRFSIVIPPPNLTGSLHMGHALQHTLHDILVRWKRMRGYNTLWLPGTDHASIAVHVVLEKQLEAEGKTRFDLGRERFLEMAWKWKETSGRTILNQMRRLGVSCDWTRERFTMDSALSRAVVEVFVRLYRDGLIYRGEYMVNWCPRCKTALSDLEVVHETKSGTLWHLKYPIVVGGGFVSVATTRPETMLGDTAVAVHPDDERYRQLVGGAVVLPVAGRTIPVIADTFVDRAFGTGAVKVTPAHDPNDYEAGRRHDLPCITVIGDDGKMTAAAGEFAGMDRFKCRTKLLERLEAEGFLLKTEPYQYNLGKCGRCSTVVEPRVSMQWFLKIAPLAQPAIEAVEHGRIEFVPDSFKKRYFEWMYNIHDWCISRQLWWGHRIPAWYCDACGAIAVGDTEPSGCGKCGGPLRPETDVLDTWFSSALWPFSTLGWPEKTRDLEVFYPTDVLITGPDIIFFWVARMIMMGLRFMGDVPFRQVHINGIVRDAQGKKMSKTRGNVIEPLELLDEYGADAVRFTLSSMAVPGTDIPFSSSRMKGYSAFANKVWNAARFAILNLGDDERPVDPPEIDALLERRDSGLELEDRWLLSRLDALAAEIDDALDKFRFHEASSLIYRFFWHELCDWYIELVKPFLTDRSRGAAERRPRVAVLIHALDSGLRILHPFMPFLTEEIWQRLPHRGESIMIQEFPTARPGRRDPEAAAAMDRLMELVAAIRSARSGMNIADRRQLDAYLIVSDPAARQLLDENLGKIQTLARLGNVMFVSEYPGGQVLLKGVSRSAGFGLDLAGAIDFQAERERLRKERAKIKDEIDRIAKKIVSHDFLERARQEVVEEHRARHAELLDRFEKLESNLRHLEP